MRLHSKYDLEIAQHHLAEPLDKKRIRRDSFPTVQQLLEAINTGPTTGTKTSNPSSDTKPPKRSSPKSDEDEQPSTQTKSATHH